MNLNELDALILHLLCSYDKKNIVEDLSVTLHYFHCFIVFPVTGNRLGFIKDIVLHDKI